MPNYVISQSPNKVILRNFEGVITTYTEPESYVDTCNCDVCKNEKSNEKLIGIAGLVQGNGISLEPEGLQRKKRNHR